MRLDTEAGACIEGNFKHDTEAGDQEKEMGLGF